MSSSERVIQDSEDEEDQDQDQDSDFHSEVASSCDPLQDTSSYAYAPSKRIAARVNSGSQPDIQMMPLLSGSASDDLPQVDFDKYLKSQSSIMVGDYGDERWLSNANSGVDHAAHVGNDNGEQVQDDGFSYTVKPSINNSSNDTPQISDAGCDVVVDEFDHPSKRRKISITQETLQTEPETGTYTNSSSNCFPSSDPAGPSQTATLLLPPPVTERNNGVLSSVNSLPIQAETPPPTIPFSEDGPQDQEEVIPEKNEHDDIQETVPQQPQPLLEANAEFSDTKKKRGRPKKLETADIIDTDTRTTSDGVEDPEQLIKKKPGRPKKRLDEVTIDQLPELINDSTFSASVSKALKKKMKRSKTTSDIPDRHSESKSESDVLWLETRTTDSAEDIRADSAASENKAIFSVTDQKANSENSLKEQHHPNEESKAPKKRGRKRKETAEEPAVSNESQNVLQDISNISKLPQQDNQGGISKGNGNEIIHDMNGTDAPETPKKIDTAVEIPADNNKTIETPTTITDKIQTTTTKQTPISSTGRVPFRVGLSRKARIAPLLKVVRK